MSVQDRIYFVEKDLLNWNTNEKIYERGSSRELSYEDILVASEFCVDWMDGEEGLKHVDTFLTQND